MVQEIMQIKIEYRCICNVLILF